MSVVVWDGITLAADRRGSVDGIALTVPKLRIVNSDLALAWVGCYDSGQELVDWYLFQEDEETPFPEMDDDNFSILIVVSKGKCFYYNGSPNKMEIHDPFMAWGDGRELALGALAMRADAIEAVNVACRFCLTCGNGVDNYVYIGKSE